MSTSTLGRSFISTAAALIVADVALATAVIVAPPGMFVPEMASPMSAVVNPQRDALVIVVVPLVTTSSHENEPRLPMTKSRPFVSLATSIPTTQLPLRAIQSSSGATVSTVDVFRTSPW